MHDETKAKKLLNLKRSEEIVLRQLSGVPQSVAVIARQAKQPRMTAFEALKSLKARGIAERVLVGKRHLWLRIETHQATGVLQMAFDTIIQRSEESNSKLFIQLYEGADELYEMLKNTFEKNTNERIVAIQSSSSAQASIKTLGVNRTIKLNELIKEKKIIIEAILQSDFLKLKEELGEEWADSYAGRAAEITFIPEGFLDVGEDIFIFKKSMFIANWREQRILEIIHPEVVDTTRKLIRGLAMLGRKVDINKMIRER